MSTMNIPARGPRRSDLYRRLGWVALALLVVGWLPGCTMVEIHTLNAVDTTRFEVDGDRLYMGDLINTRTLDQFEAMVAAHPNLKTLVLTVVPGSVDDEINLELGRRVRELGLGTHLVSGGMIASGGVDLFLAGATRTMEQGAYVGVHSWAAGFGHSGDDIDRDHGDHDIYLDYYEAVDIPADFYWFTLEAAPPDELHWMSFAELERYSMLTDELLPPGDEDFPLSELLDGPDAVGEEDGAIPVAPVDG